MAVDNSVQSLLTKLTTSLESVRTALPDTDSVQPPQDGISLLDVKTELLLAYLQNLVFLILVKIRNAGQGAGVTGSAEGPDGEEEGVEVGGQDLAVADDVVGKLVELRVYLEKGVKPLEGKLKYQIDKVLRAADAAARDAAQKPTNGHAKASKTIKGAATGSDGSEASGDDSDASSEEIDELSYRPNPAAFARPAASASVVDSRSASKTGTKETGFYRPPRITPTALPTTTQSEKRASARKPERSSTIDDYIATELSTAPIAEPSIGSTIISGGRRTKSAKDREVEDERRDYEEANFVRLAPESKKDRLKRGGAGRRENIYGGEEMAGLGAGLDRIARVTASTKRKGRMTEDGPRGDGFDAGAGKRRKVGRR